MRKISGVGELKLDKYGADFLNEISNYCQSNRLESRTDLKNATRKSRPKRNANNIDTYTISLNLFQQGNSIAEIAKLRDLAISTVETHLARFIPTGEVKLSDFVTKNKVEIIRDAIVKLSQNGELSPVKEFLGDDYSYGEIRAVLASM